MAPGDKIMIDDLRPVAHQHLSMLTAAGIPPGEALAIAAHVCALVYSGVFDEAVAEAFKVIEGGQKIDHVPLAE
jgi:hypothetical protein